MEGKRERRGEESCKLANLREEEGREKRKRRKRNQGRGEE